MPDIASLPRLGVLGVDLGSEVVGWSYWDVERGTIAPSPTSVGEWRLVSSRTTETTGIRWLRMRKCFDDLANIGLRLDLVFYEEVRNHSKSYPGKNGGPKRTSFNVDAAHAYGAAQSHLLAWTAAQGLEVVSVTIADIKRAATGKGGGKGTDKAAVLAAARARFPRIFNVVPPIGQDGADAAFIGLAGLYSLGIVPEPFA